FTMLTRKADAQMDFDFAKVVEASRDNPVFYVQYAHARIQSTLRKAEKEGLYQAADHLALLGGEELAMIREAANFPRTVEAAAKAREPHRIAFYLNDLAAAFHSLYNQGNDDAGKRFILAQEPELTSARLFLATNIGQVIRNGLRLMGVEAADNM
ncbi:MAG: arginine--tRNA ligase, partial [Sphingomonadales bacterium]|nr:arginine--tRNA ligase [Sphingomonadales bacterium]